MRHDGNTARVAAIDYTPAQDLDILPNALLIHKARLFRDARPADPA